MKYWPICSITTIVLFALTSLPARAAKEAKDTPVERFDTNNNRRIEGKEVAAMRKAYEDGKSGSLQQFDSNRDGKLSDAEIDAIQLHKPTPEPKRDPKAQKKLSNLSQKGKKK
jgi:hypothetical protein